MKRIKLGDVVAIPTNNGMSYSLYTHKNTTHGPLLRVYNKNYNSYPENFDFFMHELPDFSVFFPLGAAVNRKIVSVVDNIQIPDALLVFPLFKCGLRSPYDGKVETWWLWDGTKEWRVGRLSESEQAYPERGIVNDTFLIKRIESEYIDRDSYY